MKTLNFLTTCGAVLLLAASLRVTAAPLLIGNATLNAMNDLTVVRDGNVQYEFLDLTPTYGLSVASARSLLCFPVPTQTARS